MRKNRMTVQNVIAGSIAEEAGIEIGDVLLSINGENIEDVFDYRFLMTDEALVLEIEKGDGEIWDIDIEKDQYEDLGIDFENPLMDEMKSCSNKCIFCFIDQLPKNMRQTLYFKDDDSRMSFLAGNYVTLTNMKDEEIDRIIRYRMSPINVSVHTTNPKLRIFMLNNKFAGNVMDRIKNLVEAGIEVNCQIVLCRGINDESELDKSINELAEMYPGVKSISVVPVGITRHRDGLFELQPYDSESSDKVISQVEKLQESFVKNHDSRIVYLADEFYIMANRAIPDYKDYEDFPQIENGVGLISMLLHEFYEYLEVIVPYKTEKRTVSIATGVSPYKYIKEMTTVLENKFDGLKVNIYEIKNNYFGKNVTVTGLLTGIDLIEQLKGKELGTELLISRSMLKADEDILLDDYSLKMLEEAINIKITVVENDGKDFIEKILKINEN